MGSKMWRFSQYYSALQKIDRIMEVVLKRVQVYRLNQGSHNRFSNTND